VSSSEVNQDDGDWLASSSSVAHRNRSGRTRTSRPPAAGRKFNPLVLSEIQNAGDMLTGLLGEWNLPHSGINALLFSPGAFFFSRRNTVIQRTAWHGLPAAYWLREFPQAGGLMSYGSSLEEMNRQIGTYSGRILSGAKPADLPVARATKFARCGPREQRGDILRCRCPIGGAARLLPAPR
jgi:hypothetical protein